MDPNISEKLSEEAMNILKSKIGLIKREKGDSASKMEAAEKEKAIAEARLKEAEQKILELSKVFHAKKLQLDEKTDTMKRNLANLRRKEEALASAEAERKNLAIKEMNLTSELERANEESVSTQNNLCVMSEQADAKLGQVKQLEIRAMLADQTIEELEEQLNHAKNITITTNQKTDEVNRRLEVRLKSLTGSESLASQASSNLEHLTDKLRKLDQQMNGLHYNLETKKSGESKYRKKLAHLQAQEKNTELRIQREMDSLRKIQQIVGVMKAKKH